MPDQPQNPSTPNASRIQAMLDDLSKARQGQQTPPATTPPSIPRIPSSPLPTAPAARPPVNLPTPPAVAPQRPPVIPPSITPPPRPTAPPPMPTIPKAAPVAPQLPKPPVPPAPTPRPIPAAPPAPQKDPFTAELRTLSGDIHHITTGQAPQGVKPSPMPSAPAPSIPQKPAVPSPIIVPQAKSSGFARKALFGVIILAILSLVGFAFLWLTSGNDQVAQTPTPSPTATPVLSTKTLEFYFGNPQVIVDFSSPELIDFLDEFDATKPPFQEALVLNVQKNGQQMTAVEFLTKTANPLPPGMESALAGPWTALSYGQLEAFKRPSGTRVTNQEPDPRLILVFELANASAVNQAMQTWETREGATKIWEVFSGLLGYSEDAQEKDTFSSGVYKQIPIRYMNFSYPHLSIDYAIVLASNGKNYLVITGSRESMFFAIDRLLR